MNLLIIRKAALKRLFKDISFGLVSAQERISELIRGGLAEIIVCSYLLIKFRITVSIKLIKMQVITGK